MRRISRGVVVLAVVMPALVALTGEVASAQRPAPFERTEHREACVNYQPLRRPFFGELHLHTQYSMDAATLDTRNTPRDAYNFARGKKVGLPPFINTLTGPGPSPLLPPPPRVSSHPYCLPGEKCPFMATRTIQLPPGRALDFAAVTDHAELFGESNICFYEEMVQCTQDSECGDGFRCFGAQAQDKGRCVPLGYADYACTLAREEVSRLRTGLGTNLFATYVTAENPVRFPFCGPNG